MNTVLHSTVLLTGEAALELIDPNEKPKAAVVWDKIPKKKALEPINPKLNDQLEELKECKNGLDESLDEEETGR